MRRFFVQPDDISGQGAIITGDEAHHLRHVLRLKTGARITMFDGTGRTYEGKVTALTPEVTVEIDRFNRPVENRPSLHLAQALIKPKKTDLVVQKATELGVDSIIIFTSAYCSTNEPSESKQERWQRIAMESCKQCNRAVPPKINPLATITDCFEIAAGHDLKIIFWEESADLNLKDIEKQIKKKPPLSMFFMIGPEGGLTDEEVNLAKDHGFIPVTLGKQILRAETAGIAAAAILQFILGNLD